MKIKYLDGSRLYYAFLAGGEAVIRDKDYLNRINVFPVPDADTGTNLASTMRMIAQRARASASARHTLRSIADAAILGARGNSGLIFAQFVYGLSREVREECRLTTRHFAESLRQAVNHARRSIVTPVEGTMLTIMQDWADAVFTERHRLADFADLLTHSLQAAKRSLEETPRKLAVLAKAGVVDAGAKGFFDFIEGVAEFIRRGNIRTITKTRVEAAEVPVLPHTHKNLLGRRYCAEALLSGSGLDADRIKAAIQDLGESVIVAGSDTNVRLHIHTDRPAAVFEPLDAYGHVVEVKVDDMLRQYEAGYARRSPIALVTDSSCDLPPSLLDEHQIHVVPFLLSFGDHLYLDKLSVTPARVYELMRTSRSRATSSIPSPQAVQNVLSFLATHYESIIMVTISGGLSGFHGLAQKVREEFPGKKITILDSKHISVTQGLIVLRIAEAIRSGLSHDEIVFAAERWISSTRLWVDIRTLKYMVRSGRVSPLKGLLAKALNIKPLIALNDQGKAVPIGKAFSRRGIMRKIIGLMRAEAANGKVWNYAIVHAAIPGRARAYEERLAAVLGRKPAFVVDLAPVVGIHNGVGALGLGLLSD
ncbi:MAG: DegV family EDD domain-containing protein [Candidatus Aminicenantes bacterium]|nr:DegV family EDD domain-containing protein [Candidatus Aminicenantes bacterium]